MMMGCSLFRNSPHGQPVAISDCCEKVHNGAHENFGLNEIIIKRCCVMIL